MFLESIRRERLIRKTLRQLAKQRVLLILQPGNIWVVERAVREEKNEDLACALRTCNLRGWVETLENAVPTAGLTEDGKLPTTPEIHRIPMYKLTEAGWAAIYRTQTWLVMTCFIAMATLLVTLFALLRR